MDLGRVCEFEVSGRFMSYLEGGIHWALKPSTTVGSTLRLSHLLYEYMDP